MSQYKYVRQVSGFLLIICIYGYVVSAMAGHK